MISITKDWDTMDYYFISFTIEGIDEVNINIV